MSGDAHRKPLYTLGHYLLESEKVVILAKYAQPPVGPIEHMINVSAQCYPFRPRHKNNYPNILDKVKPKMYRTPLIPAI